MKVFEVVTEICDDDTKEIRTMAQYVTSDKDTLLSVTEYFTDQCYQYEKDLKSVKEVITITEHIKDKQIGG